MDIRSLEEIIRSRSSSRAYGVNPKALSYDSLSDERENSIELDVRGILDGGDKSSVRGVIPCSWDYLRHYATAFESFRDDRINVVEIGVLGGSSLNTWRGYFSSATIIGIDIDPACAQFERGDVKVRIGSQDDPVFLARVAEEFPPTIVIDDGSHQAHHIIASFEALFPAVLPGGLYVVEDLAFHFAEQGAEMIPRLLGEDVPVFTYFLRFIAAKAAHVSGLAGASDALNEVYRAIDEIRIVGGLLIIRKHAPRDRTRYVPEFERQLSERAIERPEQYHDGVLRYAEFLLTYDIAIDRAIGILEQALRSKPDDRKAAALLRASFEAIGMSSAAAAVAEKTGATDEELVLPAVWCPPWMAYPH